MIWDLNVGLITSKNDVGTVELISPVIIILQYLLFDKYNIIILSYFKVKARNFLYY